MSDSEGEAEGRKPGSGLAARIFQLAFIGFNLLMAAWLLSYCSAAGRMKTDAVATAVTAAQKAGAEDAVALGEGILLAFWLFGAVLLGLLASLLKRGRR